MTGVLIQTPRIGSRWARLISRNGETATVEWLHYDHLPDGERIVEASVATIAKERRGGSAAPVRVDLRRRHT